MRRAPGLAQRLPPGARSPHTRSARLSQPQLRAGEKQPSTDQAGGPGSPLIPSPDLIIDHLLSGLLFPEGVIGAHRGDDRRASGPGTGVAGHQMSVISAGVGVFGKTSIRCCLDLISLSFISNLFCTLPGNLLAALSLILSPKCAPQEELRFEDESALLLNNWVL